MRLCTDTQHMGYILRDGEKDVPEGLKKALASSNRLQDIVISGMKIGISGNQVLAKGLEQMKREGIEGLAYSHAIGNHGHGAGTLIGLWDAKRQYRVGAMFRSLPTLGIQLSFRSLQTFLSGATNASSILRKRM